MTDHAIQDEQILLEEDRGHGIVELTLNRPRAFNALSTHLMTDMQDTLDRLTSDDTCRVILVHGAGGRFCAGHDLREVRALPDLPARNALMAQCSKLMQTIVYSPKPVIAKVDGIATAAGCQLVASCDLAIATDDARFGTPGVNIGLFCHTPMVALSRNVSRKRAMEMLLTGEMADAATAKDFGLINKHVPLDQLDDAVMDMARIIASKSAYTLRIGKQTFYKQLDMDLAQAYDHASEVMVENMLARDAEEGITAFIEKRTPTWRDT